MLVRITAGIGVGQVIDMIPAIAQARIAGGTAVSVEDLTIETASVRSGERERSSKQRSQTRRSA